MKRKLTPGEYSRYKFALELLDTFNKKDFNRCEIGCGRGVFLAMLEDRNIQCLGIDLSQKAIEIARSYVQFDKIVLREGSYRELTARFDVIFMFDVLEHMEDDKKELLYISRYLLKDGGFLMASVPADKNLFGNMDIYVGHYRRYSRESLVKLFKECEFDVLVIWNYGYKIFSFVANILFNRKRRGKKPYDLSYSERSKKSSTIQFPFIWSLFSGIVVRFYPLMYLYDREMRHIERGNSCIILVTKKRCENL